MKAVMGTTWEQRVPPRGMGGFRVRSCYSGGWVAGSRVVSGKWWGGCDCRDSEGGE